MTSLRCGFILLLKLSLKFDFASERRTHHYLDLGSHSLGSWDLAIKENQRRVIYCDAFLAEDAGSQAVNGLLALKQHQLNGNGLDGRPGC